MRHKNFLEVDKNTGEKMFAKYLSADGCFVKAIILLTVMIKTCYMVPDTMAFAFTRQPMKRNFTWSNRAIHLRSSIAFLPQLKLWFAKNGRWTCLLPRQIRAFANYWDYPKIQLFSKDGTIIQSYANHVARIIDLHFVKKSRQATIRDY